MKRRLLLQGLVLAAAVPLPARAAAGTAIANPSSRESAAYCASSAAAVAASASRR